MRGLKILLSVLVILGASAAFLALGKQPEPLAEGSVSAGLLQPGALPVASYDEVFVDRSRPTNANKDFPGAPERTLEGTVWYPDSRAQAPYPLIVYSHGFTSRRNEGAGLAEHMASLGYVVVAVDYPLTHFSAPGGPEIKDVVNQPGDVSFLIDTLLAYSASADHALSGLIDAQRIGVTGVSLGGMTSTLAAYHPVMGDARIGAALSIAGPTEQFNAQFFTYRQLPFLMLAADTDALVPYAQNGAPVLEKVPGSQLVTVHNASHTGFAEPAAMLRWLDNPDAVGCYMVLNNIDPKAMKEETWYNLLGTPEQGINYDSEARLCQLDPLPSAINPLRQIMITRLVVSSFFQSQFSSDAAVREEAQRYLSEKLEREVEGVSYAAAPPQAATEAALSSASSGQL